MGILAFVLAHPDGPVHRLVTADVKGRGHGPQLKMGFISFHSMSRTNLSSEAYFHAPPDSDKILRNFDVHLLAIVMIPIYVQRQRTCGAGASRWRLRAISGGSGGGGVRAAPSPQRRSLVMLLTVLCMMRE